MPAEGVPPTPPGVKGRGVPMIFFLSCALWRPEPPQPETALGRWAQRHRIEAQVREALGGRLIMGGLGVGFVFEIQDPDGPRLRLHLETHPERPWEEFKNAAGQALAAGLEPLTAPGHPCFVVFEVPWGSRELGAAVRSILGFDDPAALNAEAHQGGSHEGMNLDFPPEL